MPLNPKDFSEIEGHVDIRDGFFTAAEDGAQVSQSFYYLHRGRKFFKGIRQILEERGLWRDGLLLKCAKGDHTSDACCAARTLINQPDFKAQRPALLEFLEEKGHLVEFYPKFHCECNWLERYWGTVKRAV